MTVNILGCGSATPSLCHLPSCQVLDHNGRLFMIDCGEGAQLSLRRAGLRFSKLRHIFISHLHGDHLLGLPGLLSTLSLHDVGGQMHVYMAAEGIPLIKKILEVCAHAPDYELIFHKVRPHHEVVYEDASLMVETFPLKHTTEAVGYIFREKPKPRKLKGDVANFYNVPVSQRAAIKAGADFVTSDGRVIENRWLTLDPDPSVSYAYASDTVYSPEVVAAVKGVDLLYHEATYGDDKADKAAQRGHSTARQAGQVAREAGVKRLLIGHYSKTYNGCEDILLKEAQEEFPNTIGAKEKMQVEI